MLYLQVFYSGVQTEVKKNVWFVQVLSASLTNFNMCVFFLIGWHRSLLGVKSADLLKENYVQFFRLLLYIEEHQMENDIHMYDCDDQIMEIVKSDSKLLSLKVS
jgi:hypothetical protein